MNISREKGIEGVICCALHRYCAIPLFPEVQQQLFLISSYAKMRSLSTLDNNIGLSLDSPGDNVNFFSRKLSTRPSKVETDLSKCF